MRKISKSTKIIKQMLESQSLPLPTHCTPNGYNLGAIICYVLFQQDKWIHDKSIDISLFKKNGS